MTINIYYILSITIIKLVNECFISILYKLIKFMCITNPILKWIKYFGIFISYSFIVLFFIQTNAIVRCKNSLLLKQYTFKNEILWSLLEKKYFSLSIYFLFSNI